MNLSRFEIFRTFLLKSARVCHYHNYTYFGILLQKTELWLTNPKSYVDHTDQALSRLQNSQNECLKVFSFLTASSTEFSNTGSEKLHQVTFELVIKFLVIFYRDGDFANFFFSASNLPDFCGFPQFWAFRTFIREREMRKKNAFKITLTEPQTEMWKNCSWKISLTEPQLRNLWTVSVMRSAHCHFANFWCFEWQQSCLEDAFSASMLFLVGGSEVA